MAYESGLGSNGTPFEYTVEVKNSKIKLKKILFIFTYAVYVIVAFVIGAATKFIAPFLAFVPLSTWVIVWLTWKYTQLSYEYSFFQGELTVNRCVGSRTKKVIAKIRIKDVEEAIQCNGNDDDIVSKNSPERVIFAASSKDAPNLMAILYTNENDKVVLYFETNEQALRIMRYYNTNLFK